MLFPVRDIIDAAKGESETELRIRQELATLADELNSELSGYLSGYEVRLIHLDGEDYLEFIPKHVPEQAREVLEAADENH